jgi:hypothetical protein
LNINEGGYSNPFMGTTGDDFDKIQHKLSPKQKEAIRKLSPSFDWVFTYWNDKNQTISIESIDTHDMRRDSMTIDKEGKIMTFDDMEQMRKQNLKQYPKDRIKPSIREVE